jgi:DNA uptake protein ComE-like DNA-binding protein
MEFLYFFAFDRVLSFYITLATLTSQLKKVTHDSSRTVQFFFKMSLRSRILEDPYYRFKSAFEIAVAGDLGVQIDVNQAGVDDWLRLPGISIHQARQLVALSQSGVAFYSISDLAAVLNTPLARLQWLAPVLSFQYYDESLAPACVNVNLATVSELAQMAQIEPELAAQIIAERSASGNFTDLVNFQQRLGLSGKSIGQLMHYLQF